MTTPTRLQRALSSPTTLPVGNQQTQICPAMDESIIIYNADLTTTVYVGYGPASGKSTSNTIPVPPLTPATVNGRRGLFAIAPTLAAGATVNVSVVPGGTYLGPSPAQIASQIAISGVSTLNNNKLITLIGFPGGQAVPVGTPFTQQLTGLTGTTYELNMFFWAAASAFLKFDMSWTDSTGNPLAHQSWWIIPGTAANQHFIKGSGPLVASNLVWTVTAFGATINMIVSMYQNSLSSSRHDLRTDSWIASPVAGTIQPTEVETLQLFQLPSTSFGIGQTITYLLPLAAGRVRFFGQSTSGAADMKVACNNLADQTSVGNNPFWKNTSDATGTIQPTEFTLPRVQCDLTITNGNAAAKSLEAALILNEY